MYCLIANYSAYDVTVKNMSQNWMTVDSFIDQWILNQRWPFWMISRIGSWTSMNVVKLKNNVQVWLVVSWLPRISTISGYTLLWRHNGRDGVSNRQPHNCLFNRLFRRRSKKTSKLRVTGLCVGNSPVTREFPAQKASNAENASIWWRHHGQIGNMGPDSHGCNSFPSLQAWQPQCRWKWSANLKRHQNWSCMELLRYEFNADDEQ